VILEPATGLARFVASVAVSVADVQARLANANDEKMAAWQQLIQPWKGSLPEIARAMAPSLLVVESCVIEAQVSIEHDITNEFSVRILNAGVVSRYASSDQFRSKLRFEVRRVPMPPGQPLSIPSPL
jgi:hypothetical protein